MYRTSRFQYRPDDQFHLTLFRFNPCKIRTYVFSIGIQEQRAVLLHRWLRRSEIELDALCKPGLLVRIAEPDSMPV